MTPFTRIFLIFLFLLAANPFIMAQFSVSGEFRPRFEYRDGYLILRDSSKTPYPTILGRNRLLFDYKQDKFSARFSLQHAYVFGDNNFSSDTISKNTVNIYEAWFRYAFNDYFAMKLGRMELFYDDGRLLGSSNWPPKGSSFDVALFQWGDGKGKYRGDFGFAINNSSPATPYLASYTLRGYKYMGYLYEQGKFFNDRLTVSFLALMDVQQKVSAAGTKPDPELLYGRFTIGGTAGYTLNKFKAYISGSYQDGKLANGKNVNAGYVAGYLSYRIFKPFNLQAGYEYMSGNDYSDQQSLKTKSTGFSTLYSSSHGFYGYMDMFSGPLAAGDGPGLTDIYAKATFKAGEKTTLEGTFRYFSLPHGFLKANDANPSPTGYLEVKKNLGSEIDLMVTHQIVKGFEVNAAYCFFLPTSTMEIYNGLKPGTSEWAQYAYVMLTWKPTFFTTDKK